MIELNSATLAAGGLIERLNEEIRKAVANCLDVNTEAKKTRTVTLKIKIKPDKTRSFADVSVETSSALCPPEAINTSIYMSQNLKTGEIAASEVGTGENPLQEILPGTENNFSGKITNFKTAHKQSI